MKPQLIDAKHRSSTFATRIQKLRLLQPNYPFPPDRIPFFYGWMIVAAATVGILMSIPGQTMGVSVFTDHLLEATGLSRLSLSNAYLIGTLTSGLLLPFGGMLLESTGGKADGGAFFCMAGTDAGVFEWMRSHLQPPRSPDSNSFFDYCSSPAHGRLYQPPIQRPGHVDPHQSQHPW